MNCALINHVLFDVDNRFQNVPDFIFWEKVLKLKKNRKMLDVQCLQLFA